MSMFSLPSLSLVAVGLSGAVLLVLLLVLHQLQLLSGPAVRGKHHAWKKDEDPALVSDSSPLLVALDKVQFTLLSMLSRRISPVLFPPPLTDLNFYSVEEHPGVSGLVAVTIDDCFCRQNDPKRSLMPPVRAMIKKSGHRVTFFTTLQYAEGEWREKEIREFVKDGHELGNHCKDDRECVSGERVERSGKRSGERSGARERRPQEGPGRARERRQGRRRVRGGRATERREGRRARAS